MRIAAGVADDNLRSAWEKQGIPTWHQTRFFCWRTNWWDPSRKVEVTPDYEASRSPGSGKNSNWNNPAGGYLRREYKTGTCWGWLQASRDFKEYISRVQKQKTLPPCERWKQKGCSPAQWILTRSGKETRDVVHVVMFDVEVLCWHCFGLYAAL